MGPVNGPGIMILLRFVTTGTLPVGSATYIEEIRDGGEGTCRHCSRPIREVQVVRKRLLTFFGRPEKEERSWVHNEDDQRVCTSLVATPKTGPDAA